MNDQGLSWSALAKKMSIYSSLEVIKIVVLPANYNLYRLFAPHLSETLHRKA